MMDFIRSKHPKDIDLEICPRNQRQQEKSEMLEILTESLKH